jgi:hypothetical protein
MEKVGEIWGNRRDEEEGFERRQLPTTQCLRGVEIALAEMI